jgi:hypothetical protein
MSHRILILFLLTASAFVLGKTLTPSQGPGRTASNDEIRKRDISVAPDGTGLPIGHGQVEDGRYIYKTLCATCHGEQGQGVGEYHPLAGGQGTLNKKDALLTVGSYWPFATTLWDYIRRAMPYQRPGTLTVDETFAVTAFVLYMNGIVDDKADLNERNLPKIQMPNRDGFVSDPRPDVTPKRP